MVWLNSALFVLSFVLMWLSSGFVVDGIAHFARKLRISSFAASFFILGILTTLPELGVGINSIIDNKPEIFVGDLIGASFVIFLVAIPLLAVFGKGIVLSHQLTNQNLVFAMFVVLNPILFSLDGSLSWKEGMFMIIVYVLLFSFIESKKLLIQEASEDILVGRKSNLIQIVKIACGSLMIFIASGVLVDKTIFFSDFFHVNPFIISLLILPLGTNLPEFLIAINSILKKNKEIAFGDYVGSAAGNTLVFGGLTIANGSITMQNAQFFLMFVMFLMGMVFFYIFSRSKRDISREEGIVMFLVYILFLVLEIRY